MLLLYKYALILVILLNINEIRSRTLNDLQGGDLQAHNGTVTSLMGAVTQHDRVHNLREKRARDSEEEDEENDDDEEDDEAEDDDSTDEDEASEKAAVELDENYMKNHDMVDTHMTELYNEVVGGKKKTKSSTKDGTDKYQVTEETDKVDYEKDKDQGEKTPSKKKKKGGKDKFMPLLIIPYAIQMVIIPFVLLKLKMIALKAMAVGKLALLILLFNYFKYQHNAKASSADEQYIHDNQLMAEHYGYSGTPEVGGWVNGRSMEEFGRRRRR